MKCPECGKKTLKAGVSRYWCASCKKWWLIQKLRTYKPPHAREKKESQEPMVCVVCQLPQELCYCHATYALPPKSRLEE